MKTLVPGLLLAATLTVGPAYAATPASTEQVHFGIAVARKGLWAEARFRFERAVALDANNAAAFNDLAIACEQQGDFAKAREAYETALRLRPGDRQIQQNFDLFREADAKRNRSKPSPTPAAAAPAGPTPAAPASPTPAS